MNNPSDLLDRIEALETLIMRLLMMHRANRTNFDQQRPFFSNLDVELEAAEVADQVLRRVSQREGMPRVASQQERGTPAD